MQEPFTPTREQRDEVHALIRKYKPIFFLQNWEFTMHFEGYADEEDRGSAICTSVQNEYLMCSWRILPLYFSLDADAREECIIHEMCHNITNPPFDMLKAMLDGQLVTPYSIKMCGEEVTSKIAVIIGSLVKRGLDKESSSGTVEVREAISPSPTEEGQSGFDCSPPSQPLIPLNDKSDGNNNSESAEECGIEPSRIDTSHERRNNKKRIRSSSSDIGEEPPGFGDGRERG